MYRQIHPRANISIESNTGKVPADGRYYVIKNGEIVKVFRTLKAANDCYQHLLEELALPPLIKEDSKASNKQVLDEYYSRIPDTNVFGGSFGSRVKKSGRFH